MPDATALSAPALLEHWQGHRRLTRRVIEAFPEDKLFTHTVGGMRTFGEMAKELLAMAQGMATDDWEAYELPDIAAKADLLRLWDESTGEINDFWERIPERRFAETITSFGTYTGPGHWQIMYVIDNEIHHRAQGYVYLRSLGVEPPPFWER